MKTNKILAMGSIMAALVVTGCGTPKVGPAKTTLAPMPNVGPLTSVKRTTVVTPASTNITMVESIQSPEEGQYQLRMKELDGNTKVGVSKYKSKGFLSWLWTPSGYCAAPFGGYTTYGGYVGSGCGSTGQNYSW